jgi:hypothetical protein
MTSVPPTVAAWHDIVRSGDASRLADLLADDVVFRSPAVHAPQEGLAKTTTYLTAAMAVLGPTLQYRRQFYSEDSAVLEFEAQLDAFTVHGVDLLRWNSDGRLVEFTVMVRPLRGLQQLMALMAQALGL